MKLRNVHMHIRMLQCCYAERCQLYSTDDKEEQHEYYGHVYAIGNMNGGTLGAEGENKSKY